MFLYGCSNNIKNIYEYNDLQNELVENSNQENNFLEETQLFYFRSFNDYSSFLNDKNIFKPIFSEQFKNFNEKFNDDFFKKNDLIIVNIGKSGSTTKHIFNFTNDKVNNIGYVKIYKKSRQSRIDAAYSWHLNFIVCEKNPNLKEISLIYRNTVLLNKKIISS